MSISKRIITSIISGVAPVMFVNAIIIIAAYLYTPILFWVLLITIPLLVLLIYKAGRTSRQSGMHVISLLAADKPNNYEKKKYQLRSHSIDRNTIEEDDLRILIGNDQCDQPYNASVFNIPSMEGTYFKKSLVQPRIDKMIDYSGSAYEESGNVYGERRYTYSLAGEDLVWKIGPNFIDGQSDNYNYNFNSKEFEENAGRAEVKMIELILSTAIKVGPNSNSPLSIGDASNIGDTLNARRRFKIFPGSWSATFREAEGMIHFLDNLRELSGGKPVGIRLFISDKREFREICHAIRKTQIVPDFIVVEGSFESADTVLVEKSAPVMMPLPEALLFVSQTLQIYGLQNKIKIIAFGKILSSLDLLKVLALGANAVYAEIPLYTTNDRKTISFYRGQTVNDFHNNLMNDTIQAMEACGFTRVSDITLPGFFRRLDILYSKSFEETSSSYSYPGILKRSVVPN